MAHANTKNPGRRTLRTRLAIRQVLLACTLAFAAGGAVAAEPTLSSRPELTGNATTAADSAWDSALAAGLVLRNFKQNGLADPGKIFLRRYLQYVPKGLDPKGKYPLVIVLPGGNLSAEFSRDGDTKDRFERLADRDKFIVVYGNAVYAKGATQDAAPNDPYFANGGYWRACLGGAGGADRAVDDVAYLRRIIQNLSDEKLPVDADRIFIVGASNGGEMAQRAAREMGDQLAGIGAVIPVLGLPANLPLLSCEAAAGQHPLSMVHIYSTHDPLLSWVWQTYFPPGETYDKAMLDSGAAWRKAIGAGDTPTRTTTIPDRVSEGTDYKGKVEWALATQHSAVVRYDYAPSPEGAAYVAYVMDHAGHGWPNPQGSDVATAENPARLGFRNQDIDAADEVWNFLKDKRRIKR
ncbi:alpha/beta hydrolase fold domain-containing protein [Niveibacterium sp. SC-1]|uniref:alpha/beta hydrolase family esterase n=1 Tax=Niveibacterium sp. SC-1 TaxID=3135646 RepID=UPI00311FB483